jgi:hypothetical protein
LITKVGAGIALMVRLTFANAPESEMAPVAENVPGAGPNGFCVWIVTGVGALAAAVDADASGSSARHTTIRALRTTTLLVRRRLAGPLSHTGRARTS